MTESFEEYFGDRQDAQDEEQPVSAGPVQLRSQQSRWGNFGCLFVFALVWNAIVLAFILNIFAQKDGKLVFIVFVIPFVLVGLGLVIAVIYSFLALFNPVPVVVVDNAHLIPGSRTMVHWSFRGSPSSLRSFALTLVGRESATYQRGTATHTDSEEFCEVTFFQSDVPAAIAAGSAEVTLPERTMHTFSARHNKIEWLLRARGKIPFWPDVREEFSLTVYPS